MNEPQAPAQTVPARLFHGWIVVGGAFAALFIAFGIAYSFAAFFPSLQAEFSATRGDTSLVFAISAFLFFSLGALSGPLADRGDGRKVVAAGMVMIVVGLGLAALAESLWQVYLAYGLGVGLGVGFVYVPSLGAVQHWFRARRGMASGIAVAGIGCGTLAVPMAATAVIDQWDWRAAYGGLAVIALVFGIAVTRLLENDPAMRGLTVDGIVAADDK
ncbi:MAG: MFS transporter, partial [Rhodospirillales bacterium]|nr:MFS transporter [Rhodospirillales bacterium]